MFLTLALLCVAGAANAVTEEVVHECDYSTKSSYPWYVMGKPNNADFYVSDGVLVVTNPVEQANNYDLQPFIDDNITAETGCNYIIRLTYKTTVAGNVTLNMGTWSSSKTVDVALTVSDDFQTVDGALNDYNTSASNIHILLQMGKLVGTVYVQKVQLIYLVPDDPLLKPKQDLQKAIAAAELQDATFKTEDSFSALQQAISDAKAALDASDATIESLQAATEAVNNAVNALELQEEYTKLTADMFKQWDDNYNPSTGSSVGCAYVIGSSTSQPYGDASVYYLKFADISEYDKLILTVTDGTPRIMMNRLEVGNGGGDSNGGSYVQITDAPVDGVVEVDLTKYDYAHLNAIKGANYGNVTITGMYLYKASDPLAMDKEALQAAINKGKAVKPFGKTEESFNTLTGAISDGESALETATSAEELESAKQAIENAISGLTIADGYTALTQEMFKKWTAADATAEESGTPNFESHLGEGINAGATLYGDGSVYWHNFADLSDYGTIYFVGNPGIQVRCLFNRAEDPSNNGALVEKVITVNEEGVAEFDLTTLTEGYAHLNSVKIPWNNSTGNIITDILLTELTTVPVTITDAGYATFCPKKAVALETAMKAYAVEYAGTSALLIPVEGSVEANTPVILEASEGDYDLNIVESGAAPEKNDLLVSDGNVVGDGTVYVLANGSKGVGFYKLAADVKVPAGKAYLKAAAEGREFIGFGDATAIKSIETVKADGAIYNLAGQQVKSAQKGVFIVNGKKAVVK